MAEDVIARVGVADSSVRVGIGEGAVVDIKVGAGGVAVGMVVEAELGVAVLPHPAIISPANTTCTARDKGLRFISQTVLGYLC
jgi:hypothetical protein